MQYLTRHEKNILPDMKLLDNYRIPTASDTFRMAHIEIDNEGCNGCELCVDACPANVLEMIGKTAVGMKGDNAACIGCGVCVAICLPKVISIDRFQHYEGLYRFIGRAEAMSPRQF
jgi:2-oxoglutarate ferredoxin oxidoreductase subunit delta